MAVGITPDTAASLPAHRRHLVPKQCALTRQESVLHLSGVFVSADTQVAEALITECHLLRRRIARLL